MGRKKSSVQGLNTYTFIILDAINTALYSSSKSLSEPDQSCVAFSFSLSSLSSLPSSKYFTGALALPARAGRLATASLSGSSSLELSTAGFDFFGGDFLGCIEK